MAASQAKYVRPTSFLLISIDQKNHFVQLMHGVFAFIRRHMEAA
jgi:hypothetical protein